MSDTTQTTTPAPVQQGTHQYLITLQIPIGGGFGVGSWTGTWTPAAGATRHDIYQALCKDIADKHPEYRNASVLFFDLQPNQL